MGHSTRFERRLRMLKCVGVIAAAYLGLGTTASAQVDLSGEWKPLFYQDWMDRVPGPDLGDYLGLPINAAARMRADTWSPEMEDTIDYPCRPHGLDYITWGPSNMDITKQVDPLSRIDT